MFYAELLLAPDTGEFDTLGNAIWFGIVTFSTVGYGDFSPTTWLGKIFSTLGIASGMLWFAMPITIVGTSFQNEWDARNLRVFAEALQTELLEQNLMTHDLVCAVPPGLVSRSRSPPTLRLPSLFVRHSTRSFCRSTLTRTASSMRKSLRSSSWHIPG